MKSIQLNLNARMWPEVFSITLERSDEILKECEPLFIKMIIEKEYSNRDLLRDILSLAQTENEQNYLMFFAAQKCSQMEQYQDELFIAYEFATNFRVHGSKKKGAGGLEELLGGGGVNILRI